MPIRENTAPMTTGTGPYGGVEMGGMFSVLKVRRNQKPGDYQDPGWFRQPPGSRAFEWTGALPDPARAGSPAPAGPQTEVQIRKPTGHAAH